MLAGVIRDISVLLPSVSLPPEPDKENTEPSGAANARHTCVISSSSPVATHTKKETICQRKQRVSRINMLRLGKWGQMFSTDFKERRREGFVT